MMVLVTYDVDTTDQAGRRRLHRVAKVCDSVGQRVQKSVFECVVDAAQFVEFKQRLCRIIDEEKDSLRFYFLGNNWQRRVEHVGAKPSLDPEGILIT
ncbi:MAG: CRISPR-associated endonuclease Cas2 [Chloroflexota bacterium]